MRYFKQFVRSQSQQQSISGQIPTSFGNLTSLRALDISANYLNGSIPITIGNV